MLPGKKYAADDYLRIAWTRKWLIVVPTVVAAIGTIAVSLTLPDRYRSEATVLIVPQRVPTNFVQPTITARLDERLSALSQQILSRTRLEALIREFDLYQDKRKTMVMEDVVEEMRKDIHVEIPRPSSRRSDPGSFTVAFDSAKPQTAMKVTERLASMFIDDNLQDREGLAAQTSEFLQTQLEDARRKLSEHEAKLEAYRRAHDGELPTQVDSNLQVMQTMQQQLQASVEATNRDVDRRMIIDKELADASATVVTPPAASAGGVSTTGSAAEQLAAARAQLAALQLRLKPQHPDIVSLQHRIRELEQKAQAEAAEQPLGPVTPARAVSPAEAAQRKRLTDLEAERDVLERRIAAGIADQKRLQDAITSYRARIEAAPTREAELTELMRDYQTLQDTYKNLLVKSQEASVAQNLERRQIGQQFRIIDPAVLPQQPISPNRLRINMMGTLGGLAFGFALVALLEYRDTTFKSDADIVTSLALPVFAVIPAMVTAAEKQQRSRTRRIAWATSAVLVISAAAVAAWRLHLVATWVR